MNPEFLKKLQEITAALRGGLVFNPLSELQKRATQAGEGYGHQIERDRAQAAYSKSHPQSERARREMITNSMMLALSTLKPEGAESGVVGHIEPKGDAAFAMHMNKAEGARGTIEAGYGTPALRDEYFKAMNAALRVMNEQPTSRELFQKQFPEGVKQLEWIRDQLEQKQQPPKRPDLKLVTDSVVTKLAHPLADLVKREGKVFHRGDNDVTIFFRGKQYHGSDEGSVGAYTNALNTIPHSVAPSAKTMLEALHADKGFTIDPLTGEKVTSGYAVGGGEKNGILLKKPLKDLTEDQLQLFLNANHDKLPKGSKWGGWVDEGGDVYVEPADIHSDLNSASRVGNERGEKALYDLSSGTEVPLKVAKAEAVAAKQNEWQSQMDKWNTLWGQYQGTAKEVRSFPDERRKALADALRPPQAPWLIKPPNGTPLDPSKLGPGLPEGVSGDALATKQSARADFSVLDKVLKRVRKVYSPHAIAELEANPKSAGWYDLTQLKKVFEDENPEGAKDFNMAMQLLGPTSTATKVPQNIRQASNFYHLWKSGKLNPEALKNGTLELPPGYANMRQKSVNSGVLKLLQKGELDPVATPKTFRYSSQLAGKNWGNAVIDMHVGRQIGEKGMAYNSKSKQMEPSTGFPIASFKESGVVQSSPRNTQYPVIEKAMQSEAKRLDLPTAAYQALGWIGGGKKTGISDSRSMLEVYNEIFAKTAAKYGYKSATDAMRAWVRGETPLW